MKTGVADCRTAKTHKPEECKGPVWGNTRRFASPGAPAAARPIPAVRGAAIEPLESTQPGHF